MNEGDRRTEGDAAPEEPSPDGSAAAGANRNAGVGSADDAAPGPGGGPETEPGSQSAPNGLWSSTPPSRIEDYGMVADLQTAALIARDGSVDWLCVPRFDSSACFAALLGGPTAGRWRVAPLAGGVCTSREYRDDTMILESVWETDEGSVKVVDFMPIRQTEPDLVRIVEGLSGTVRMGVELVARFDYGGVVPWVRHTGERWVGIAGPDSLWLDSPVRLRGRNMRSMAEFTVSAGERMPFVLTWAPSYEDQPPRYDAERALRETEQFWRDWISDCTYEGRYADAVRR